MVHSHTVEHALIAIPVAQLLWPLPRKSINNTSHHCMIPTVYQAVTLSVIRTIGARRTAGLTNMGALFGKKLWGLPTRPTRSKWKAEWTCSVQFLSNFFSRLFWKWLWHTVKTKKFSDLCTWETCVSSSAYFWLVCSETFSLFFTNIGNYMTS